MSNAFLYTYAAVPSEVVVDGFLDDGEVAVLYARWKDSWPTPIEYPGGVKGITCENILGVPQSTLNRTYGKVLGTKLLEIAKVNSNA